MIKREISLRCLRRAKPSPFLKMMHPGFHSRLPNAQRPMTDKKPEGERIQDLMNRIDMEIERLNWTIEQGREHLMKYYGKRSRLLLTEEELDNFLLYLQLTDSPNPKPQPHD